MVALLAGLVMVVGLVAALALGGEEVSETFGYCPDDMTVPPGSVVACE
jgi:hypothetical protein